MGPNDPFGSAPLREASAPTTDAPLRREPRRTGEHEPRRTSPIAIGFGLGVATGLLALLTSFSDALAVLGLGLLGAALGAAVQLLIPFSSNLRAAVLTLLGRES